MTGFLFWESKHPYLQVVKSGGKAIFRNSINCHKDSNPILPLVVMAPFMSYFILRLFVILINRNLQVVTFYPHSKWTCNYLQFLRDFHYILKNSLYFESHFFFHKTFDSVLESSYRIEWLKTSNVRQRMKRIQNFI